MDYNYAHKGTFIAIEGIDGSGKTTQIEILAEKLRILGYPVKTIHFPQYGEKSAGLIKEYLNGKLGTAEEVGPYRASLFFAIDRFGASTKIREWLRNGYVVIADRYVASNMAHQGEKFETEEERKEFFNWLYEMEYEFFGIPKPDLNLILHVDTFVARELIKKRGAGKYIEKGGKDILENDLEHLRRTEQIYLEIAALFTDFDIIDCTENGHFHSRERIAYRVWQRVEDLVRSISHLHYNPNFIKTRITEEALKHEGPRRDQDNSNKIIIKRLSPIAKLPTSGSPNGTEFHLFSTQYQLLPSGKRAEVKAGIKTFFNEKYLGVIKDIEDLSRHGIHTANTVINHEHDQELTVTLINYSNNDFHVSPGQKIAQVIIQRVERFEVEEEK